MFSNTNQVVFVPERVVTREKNIQPEQTSSVNLSVFLQKCTQLARILVVGLLWNSLGLTQISGFYLGHYVGFWLILVESVMKSKK